MIFVFICALLFVFVAFCVVPHREHDENGYYYIIIFSKESVTV